MKICTRCRIEKPLIDFNRNGNAHRSQCKACQALSRRRDLAKHRVHQARYIERKRAGVTGQKVFDPAREADRNREKSRKFRRDYPERCNAARAMYDAAKIHRTPKWLTAQHKADISKIYARARELTRLTGVQYHVDHIVPLRGRTVSGLHVPWNLQVLRGDINMAKSNKVP